MKKLFPYLTFLFLCPFVKADITGIVTAPAGSNGQVQVNKSGRFGADPGLSYSTATHSLSVGGGLTVKGPNPWVDITHPDFGTCVGDAATDCTASINAALAYAKAHNISDVKIPAPSGQGYKITSTINLSGYVNMHIFGEGQINGPLQFGPSPAVKLITGYIPGGGPAFYVDGATTAASGFTFENLSFDSGNKAVVLKNTSGVRFINVGMQVQDTGLTDNVSILMSDVFWIWFDQCNFHGPTTDGLNPAIIVRGESSTFVETSYLIKFSDCRFQYGGMKYEQLVNVPGSRGAEQIEFRSCLVENSASPLVNLHVDSSATSTMQFRRWVFENCLFDDSLGTQPLVQVDSGTVNDFVFVNSYGIGSKLAVVTGNRNFIARVENCISQYIYDATGNYYVNQYILTEKVQGIDIVVPDSNQNNYTNWNTTLGPPLRMFTGTNQPNANFGIGSDGTLSWGPGGVTGGWDTNFWRSSANVLTTTASIHAGSFIGDGSGLTGIPSFSAATNTFTGSVNMSTVSISGPRPWIDVTAPPYNAVGNGIANDTVAIQTALNAVPAGGGTVFFPAGTYVVSSTLTVSSPCTRLLGGGRRQRIATYAPSKIYYTGTGSVFLLSGNQGFLMEALHVDYTTTGTGAIVNAGTIASGYIKGCHFVGTPSRTATGLLVTDGSGWSIEDVDMEYLNIGMDLQYNNGDTWVKNVSVSLCNVGTRIGYVGGSSGLSFTGLDYENNTNGIDIYNANSVHISDSYFEQDTSGSYILRVLGTASATPQNITLKDSYSNGTSTAAFAVYLSSVTNFEASNILTVNYTSGFIFNAHIAVANVHLDKLTVSGDMINDATGVVINRNAEKLGLGPVKPDTMIHMKTSGSTLPRIKFESAARTWIFGLDTAPDSFFLRDDTAGTNVFAFGGNGGKSTMTATMNITGSLDIGASGRTITAFLGDNTSWNPASISSGTTTSFNDTITGAALGDICVCSMSTIGTTEGAILSCAVTGTDTVKVTLKNDTTGALDLANGTVKIRLIRW